MRKIGLILAVILLVVCFGSTLSVSAASAMQAEAKAGDARVDGIVGRNEYASAFVLKASNTSSWGGWESIRTPITYRFAWSIKGLYLAITYDADAVGEASLLQFVCNPGGQLRGDQEGLFFTIYPNHRVTLHNHATQLGDASVEPFDLSGKVTIASNVHNEYRTTEVLLPINAFRITDPNFTFEPGTMAASAVVMPHVNGTYMTGAAVSSNLEGWDLDTIGLGTLTLKAFSPSDGETDYDPDFGMDPFDSESHFDPDNNNGGRAIFHVATILLIVFAILGVVVFIFAITLMIILCVRNRKRKKQRKV